MRAEEIEHREVSCRLAHRGAQQIGRQTGQREEALGPRRVRQNPRERTQRKPGRVFN